MPSQPPPPIWKTGADALEDDMANRGMLPKFRPATLGVTATVRPLIRPVKAAPAPPVPSPPRRSEAVVESQAAIETERLLGDDDHEMPTANGVGEASTLNRGPVTVPREMVRATPRGGRGNVMQLQFEDETQARPQDAPNRYDAVVTPVRSVKADLGVDYDALPSLEVRAQYESEGEFSQGGPEPITEAAIRESAPVRRLDVRDRDEASYRAPDSYDEPRAYQEPNPGYLAPEPSYREPEPSYPVEVRQEEDEFWGRREGSGPRSRPVPPDPPRSYAAPVPAYDDDSGSRPWGEPPPLAPVTVGYQHPAAGFSPPPTPPPMEMRGAPAFVMGVQPIRTSTPDAWGTPQAQPGYAQGYQQGYQPQGYLPAPAQAMQQGMPAGYGVAANQAHPYVVQARGAQPTPWPAQPQPYYPSQYPSAHPSNHPSGPQAYPQQHGAAAIPSSRPGASVGQPGSAQLASPQSTAAKIGRFAWFVAGAAFGIMFAFFATGFFSSAGSAKKEAAPPAPTQAAQAPQAPTAQQPQAMPMQQAPLAQQQAPQPFAQPQPQFAPQPFAPPQPPPVFQQPPLQAQAPQPQFAPTPPVAFAQPPVVGVPQASPNAQQRPQPVAQRPAPPRAQRPAPPVRRPTRASSDDGPAAPAAAPAPAAAASDLSDLLGAGLKP